MLIRQLTNLPTLDSFHICDFDFVLSGSDE